MIQSKAHMKKAKSNYENIALFYDSAMGERAETIVLLNKLIKLHHLKAKSVLELGCGTGEILRGLSKKFELAGIDSSTAMLAVARKKLPKARLFKGRMENFHIPGRYDVVFSVFDSINHLLSFSSWRATFENVQKHLHPKGIFIFDVNTEYKLRKIEKLPPRVVRFGKSYMIMHCSRSKRGRGRTLFIVKIFEHHNKNSFKLHEDIIPEISFPLPRVIRELRKSFELISVFDENNKKPSITSRRVYFACRSKVDKNSR